MKLAKDLWDKQFREGKWIHLSSINEAGRNAIIGMYYNKFKPNSKVLDVGCGYGTILDYIDPETYLGIDISGEAIKNAWEKRNKQNCEFKVTDLTAFRTKKKFDTIIFNEVLYYVDSTLALKKYETLLNKQGIFIISIYQHPKTELIWDKIQHIYSLLNTILIIQNNNRWKIGVFDTKNI